MSHRYDYKGFTYGGIHSSALKVYRVSQGKRYETPLSPNMEDITVSVPGGDGQFYFGTTYGVQNFTLNLAFDSLSEADFQILRETFDTKKVQTLIFDELPYKVYSVKPTGNTTFKYLVFDEGSNKERIYKGDASIGLTAFNPYAKSRFKWLNEYVNTVASPNIPEWTQDTLGNRGEWSAASRIIVNPQIKNAQDEFEDKYDFFRNGQYTVYNAGDIDTPFRLIFTFSGSTIGEAGGFSIGIDGEAEQLNFKQIVKKGIDTKIVIDSNIYVVEGLIGTGQKSGRLYNEYIISGDFFKLPKGESSLVIGGAEPDMIEYHYLYL